MPFSQSYHMMEVYSHYMINNTLFIICQTHDESLSQLHKAFCTVYGDIEGEPIGRPCR